MRPAHRAWGLGLAIALAVVSACGQGSDPETVNRALAGVQRARPGGMDTLARAAASEGITAEQAPEVISLLADGGCLHIGSQLESGALDRRTARDFFAALADNEAVVEATIDAIVECATAWVDDDPTRIVSEGFERRWISQGAPVLAAAEAGIDDAGTEPDGDDMRHRVIEHSRQRAVDALVVAGEITQPEPGVAAAVGTIEGYLNRFDPFTNFMDTAFEELKAFDGYDDAVPFRDADDAW